MRSAAASNSMTLATLAHRLLGPERVTMIHAVSPAVPPEATARVARAGARAKAGDLVRARRRRVRRRATTSTTQSTAAISARPTFTAPWRGLLATAFLSGRESRRSRRIPSGAGGRARARRPASVRRGGDRQGRGSGAGARAWARRASRNCRPRPASRAAWRRRSPSSRRS